ncbi:MAG: RsbRD N-terminal domain-containing protein [Deltaproteobacteria bacterium]|nr:RsbRD N-terminal domain-containing protein [Deltaproteobacteria bacterium]
MDLEGLLKEKRADILDRWLRMILDTYPPDAARIFALGKDPFANPLGDTIRRATSDIFDAIVDGAEPDRLTAAVDELVKIRAIQSFKPSEALACLFFLKKVVRDVGKDNGDAPDFERFDTKVDHMVLLGFEAYVNSREKIANIRVAETRRALGKLLERAEIAVGVPGLQSETKDNVEVEANT